MVLVADLVVIRLDFLVLIRILWGADFFSALFFYDYRRHDIVCGFELDEVLRCTIN